MKSIKFLALMLVALVGFSACSSDENEPEIPTDPVIVTDKDIAGYIFVKSNYFNSYYGDQARLKYEKAAAGYNVTFTDPLWGDGLIEQARVTDSGEVSGTGKLTIKNYGREKKDYTYDVVLGGTIYNPTFTVADLMGGSTITFYTGTAPVNCQLQADYTGENSVMVGDNFGPYVAKDMTCKVTANEDGTINVTIPEYVLTETAIGDLTVGKITISNIALNDNLKTYYRVYGEDGLKQHFKAEKDGNVNMDADYDVTPASTLEVSVIRMGENVGVRIKNSFQLGRMPFPIVATFEGAIPSEK